MASKHMRLLQLEHQTGLRNTPDFFAVIYVKEKYPGWKGSDYQAFKLWLDDQLAENEASNDMDQSEMCS